MVSPAIPYWRLWVDADGISRQAQHALEGHQFSHFAEGAAPLWSALHGKEMTTLITLVLPAGGVYDWHENPKPQWIVPLQGSWAVETMDGQTVTMGPGELSFGGDQGTRAGCGHRSRTVGPEDAVLLLVQVDTSPPWAPLGKGT